jgi:hypothetical protein
VAIFQWSAPGTEIFRPVENAELRDDCCRPRPKRNRCPDTVFASAPFSAPPVQ